MTWYVSRYLVKNYCSYCQGWFPKGTKHCPRCGIMLRRGNNKSHSRRDMKISGITGREVTYA
jgi:predicted amidophosphoribosyltransferase